MNNLSQQNQDIIPTEDDYIPSTLAQPPHKPKRRWFSLIMGMSFLIVLYLGLQLGRQWIDSLMARWDAEKHVHPDQSKILSDIKPQISPTIQLVSRFQNGQIYRTLMDAEQYSNFVQQHLQFLEQARRQLQININQSLKSDLRLLFQDMHQRIPRFADWYFSYLTTYDLLLKASVSVAQHGLSNEAQSLSNAVVYDLQKYFQHHYEKIVLQPEIYEPILQTIYLEHLKYAHLQWLETLANVQDKFQFFVAQQTSHVTDNNQIIFELDWGNQLNKINIANYHKSGIEAWRGIILASGGGIAGKAVGSLVAKGIAAETALFTKLAVPFATKALAVGGSGMVGALGGPIGAVIGIAGGIGIDYLFNEGLNLIQRDEFIKDSGIALQSTKQVWEQLLQKSLHDTIQVWFEDSIQLLPKYEATQKK
jgi:hypothetical protein